MNCLKTGAYVCLVDYSIYAPADIFAVGEQTRVVRFNGNPRDHARFNPERPVTHNLYLNREPNWWRCDLGVAVVSTNDLEEVRP